ncbi:MAG: cation diffusion facilitator family transporter [Atopobiaceae bacterium]|nr:cation diffusion facilitator family transporter [Atopobiaceae bacterium]MCH4119125.1 cation diffusion facilitator family transporter [Atopobiaceae bacterium]MCI1318112.1 cation diffusion facilitator family transporter [Atopobiaceae bacterium]MCI1388616.1 cation diffusion facilitator family transporter [Atopobiaceae bacterium]MCI1432115.1 cation diffusion facilitator family transporter [Atopobiaceae bacterium]
MAQATTPDVESRAGETSDRQRTIVRASVVGIAANVALAAFKAAVGLASNSIAVILDAVNNLSDALSSVITIVGTRLAAKPADRNHPFGHGRVEYLTTTVIALIILYAGVSSLVESVRKVIWPEPASYDVLSLAIIAVAVAAKLLLSSYVTRKGKEAGSDTLVASGSDARFDAVLSASVLAAALVYIASGVSLEAWVGIAISAFIVKAGIEMISGAVSDMLGQRITPELSAQVKSIARGVDGVLGVYDLFLHAYGPELLVGSLHVEVVDTMTASQIDVLTRAIESRVLKETNCKVVIAAVGIYSHNTHDDAAAEAESKAREILEGHPEVVQMHGFYVDVGRRYMRMDCVVTFDADREGIRQHLTEDMREAFPGYSIWITLDLDVSD